MPKITTTDNAFSLDVPYGSEWTQLAEYYPFIPVKFGCRRGDCGACAIKIAAGIENLTKKGENEEKTLARKKLPSGYRLGCQCAIIGDIILEST